MGGSEGGNVKDIALLRRTDGGTRDYVTEY
jgi:hypothetical protein